MNSHADGCWHCGEPLPANVTIQATVAGQAHAVCCHGCRAAAEWIDQLGLSGYYQLRSAPAQRPLEATDIPWSDPAYSRHVIRELGQTRHEVILALQGVRCSACVWLIERVLDGLPGVENVQVNGGSQRVRVVWRGTPALLTKIVSALSRAGYGALPLDARVIDDARRQESRQAMKRLLVAGFGAMQAMMYAAGLYLGIVDQMDQPTHALLRWLGLLVATPVVFYSAQPFFAGALRGLRARRPGMDVPIAAAVALIYAASVFAAFNGMSEVYFDSVSMLVFFLLAGRYLEMRARHHAGDLSDALIRQIPSTATRLRADETLEQVNALELQPGDTVHVAEGGIVPADGSLVSAQCHVNEALISGESVPQYRSRGQTLISGSVVINGPVRMKVERVGMDTVLAGITTLVQRAQAERPRLATEGERAATFFVTRVFMLAALTAAIWGLIDPARAFSATVAVLVVSCPCAFALAVPAAITRALVVLARYQVLVVRPDAIEALAQATHVIFDKTGTLTHPELSVNDIDPFGGISRADALDLAAALSEQSRHPLARMISQMATNGQSLHAEAVSESVGQGLSGVVSGRALRLGRPAFALPAGVAVELDNSALLLADEHGPLATFHFGESLRSDAGDAMNQLRAQGLQIEIVSGDRPEKVAAIARSLGISHWRAQQSPADKLARLTALRAQGARVIAVGDGINDAPVLAGADVSIALASGTELAQVCSEIVLTGKHLSAIAQARLIAINTRANLRQNQLWALGYNITAVPLAALGFVPPWLAALGMSLSSLVVVLNALRIGRHDAPDRPAIPAPVALRGRTA